MALTQPPVTSGLIAMVDPDAQPHLGSGTSGSWVNSAPAGVALDGYGYAVNGSAGWDAVMATEDPSWVGLLAPTARPMIVGVPADGMFSLNETPRTDTRFTVVTFVARMSAAALAGPGLDLAWPYLARYGNAIQTGYFMYESAGNRVRDYRYPGGAGTVSWDFLQAYETVTHAMTFDRAAGTVRASVQGAPTTPTGPVNSASMTTCHFMGTFASLCTLAYNRVLTDTEIAQLHAWWQTQLTAPVTLTATPGIVDVALSWLEPTGPCTVRRDGTQVAAGVTSPWTDTGLVADTAYTYNVTSASHAGSVATRTLPRAPVTLTATPAPTEIALSWLEPTGPCTVRRDGTQVATGVTSPWTDTGLVPSTDHTYQVDSPTHVGTVATRTLPLHGPWSDPLPVVVPDPAAPVGPPVVRLTVDGKDVTGRAIARLRAERGTSGPTPNPRPSQLSVGVRTDVLAARTLRAGATTDSTVRLRLNGVPRFVGTLTDLTVGWEVGWDDTLFGTADLVAVGPLTRLGWCNITGARTPETDGQRARWILDECYGAWPHTVSPGVEQLLPRTYDWTDAAEALTLVNRSTQARCYDRGDGTVVWADRLEGAGEAVEVPASAVVADGARQAAHAGDRVNRCVVIWGAAPEGGDRPAEVHSADVATHERRSTSIDTDLAVQADAARYAERVVAARFAATWRAPEITVDVSGSPLATVWPLIVHPVEIGMHVRVGPFPPDAPRQYYDGVVEGVRDVVDTDGAGNLRWRIVLLLSDVPAPESWPLELTATPQGTSTIRLAWSAHPRAATYTVREGTTIRAVVAAPTTTWDHTGLAAGSTHTYTVTSATTDGATIDTGTATARTVAVGDADPVTITGAYARAGRCRITVALPDDPDLKDYVLVARTDRYPTGPTDGTVSGPHTTAGTRDLFGPGTADRPDSTTYVRAYSRNLLDAYNTAQWAQTAVTFLRSPVELAPDGRDAYGATGGGWEGKNRVRAGNTSANTYRGLWWYGTRARDVLLGRVVASCHLLVSRGDGGPSGAMALDAGTHTYTTRPAGQPTIGDRRQRGSVPRNTDAWVDVGADLGQKLSDGTARGLGCAYDTTDVMRVWVGRATTGDGTVHVRHTDFP